MQPGFFIRSPGRLARVVWRGRAAHSDAEHRRAAVDWLLRAQAAAGGGGYAHSFHLLRGWRPAYPETTGYLLPTLHAAQARDRRADVADSLRRAIVWLRGVQRPDGAFLDLEGRPQVFDTGQILVGLNYLAERAPELADRDAQRRAARWLTAVQEANGSFVRHAWGGIAHAYYARVGAALIHAGRLLEEPALAAAGARNLDWVLTQQEANGFLRTLSFGGEPPFLHTMVYVIEGLLDGHVFGGHAPCLAAARHFAAGLRSAPRARAGVPASQYRADYSVANGGLCLTGLAQWAGVCFRLARLEADDAWRVEGVRSLDAVRQRQIFARDRDLHGALAGSAPVWGAYLRWAFPNWALKFFLDALRLQEEA